MSATATFQTTLTLMQCPNCGGGYAISQSYLSEALRLGDFKKCWTCPYCRTERGYGEGDADRFRKQIQQLQAEKESAQRFQKWAEERKDYYKKESEHFRKSRDGMKGALIKERKRIRNGVCPCCNRHFTNLERHMASQHPNHGTPLPS